MHRTTAATAAASVALAAGGAYLVGTLHSAKPAAAAPAVAESSTGVVVSGAGRTSGTPDVMRVALGVAVRKADVTSALSEANALQRRVLAAVTHDGVAAKDTQTSGVSIYPSTTSKGVPNGYMVSEQLVVKIHNLAAAGRTIGDAVTAGGNATRLQNVSFSLEDNAALMTKARDAAYADARQKAQRYAELAGQHLGKVQTISEQVSGPDYKMMPMPMAAAASLRSAVLPISPGQSDLQVTVTVRWSLG